MYILNTSSSTNCLKNEIKWFLKNKSDELTQQVLEMLLQPELRVALESALALVRLVLLALIRPGWSVPMPLV